MAAPVTNQNYTQQINQAFDMLKYATPQQMQTVSQQVQQNPNSPEAMALAMAAQYQQQARAPRPQAPQGTILQQKLQEFQQTSPQGLPQVGQNQMAMQQAAQQNPMFGAGLAVAPENTEQAPQQMAATGGITALAHGGEVRGFDGTDGSLAALTALADEEEGDEIGNEGRMFENFAKQAKNTGTDLLDKYKAYTNTAPSAGLPSINLGGDPSSPTGAYKAPTLDTAISDMGVPTTGGTSPKIKSTLSDFETAPKTKPKVKAHHSKKDSAPAPGSSAEAIAASPTAKGETYKVPEVAVTPAKALTAEESIAEYQKLLGPEADMSEEVGMARENAANASRDKGLGALVGGIGGMLSAETPYMGQAIGAGLMSGLSSYQQGSKDEQTANKDLMALQMAQKKSDLAGHRTAAEAYIGAQIKAATAAEEARTRIHELQMTQGSAAKVAGINAASAANVAKINAASAQTRQAIEAMSAMELKQYEAGTLSMDKIADIVGRSAQGGNSPEDTQTIVQEFMALMVQNKGMGGASNPFAPVGNTGVFYNPKK